MGKSLVSSPNFVSLPLKKESLKKWNYSNSRVDCSEGLTWRLPTLVTQQILDHLSLQDVLNLRLVSKTLNGWVRDYPGQCKLLQQFKVEVKEEELRKVLDSGLRFSHFHLHLRDCESVRLVKEFLEAFGIETIDSLQVNTVKGFNCEEELHFFEAFEGLKYLYIYCLSVSGDTAIRIPEEEPWILDNVFGNIQVLKIDAIKYEEPMTSELLERNREEYELKFFCRLVERCKSLEFLKIPRLDFENVFNSNSSPHIVNYSGIKLLKHVTEYLACSESVWNLQFLDVGNFNVTLEDVGTEASNNLRIVESIFQDFSVIYNKDLFTKSPPLILNFHSSLLQFSGNLSNESLNSITNHVSSLEIDQLNGNVRLLYFNQVRKVTLVLSKCHIMDADALTATVNVIEEFRWSKLTELEIVFDKETRVEVQEQNLIKLLNFLGHNRLDKTMQITELTLDYPNFGNSIGDHFKNSEKFDLFYELYKNRVWVRLKKLEVKGSWDFKLEWPFHFNFFSQVACQNLREFLISNRLKISRSRSEEIQAQMRNNRMKHCTIKLI